MEMYARFFTLSSDRESFDLVTLSEPLTLLLNRSGLNSATFLARSSPLSYTSDMSSARQMEKLLAPKLYNASYTVSLPDITLPSSLVTLRRPVR